MEEHTVWSLLWAAKFTMLGLVLAVPILLALAGCALGCRRLSNKVYALQEVCRSRRPRASVLEGIDLLLSPFNEQSPPSTATPPLNHPWSRLPPHALGVA